MDRLQHEAAREAMDRSVGPALMRQLADPLISDDDRKEVEHTLAVIDDPRSLVPLYALIGVPGELPTTDQVVRRSAITVLTQSANHPTGNDLRRWWVSGDPDLMVAALPLMDRTESDLVQSVLDDPTHSMLPEALLAMGFGFEEPWWQQQKIEALGHHDAEVRRAAAHCLLWDEPVTAEPKLLAATFDPDESVAQEAVAALRYYPTIAVLRRLVDFGDVIATADVLDYFQMAADEPGEVGVLMKRWMVDVAGLITASQENAPLAPMIRSIERVVIPWTKELVAAVVDPNMLADEVHDRLRRVDRQSVRPDQRESVAELLCMHIDSNIRELGAGFAVEWGFGKMAMMLLEDPVATVRKSAMYALHDLDRSIGSVLSLAETVKALIDGGTISGTRAGEAIRTYVAHASPETVLEDLRAYVLNDLRSSVVVSSIEELAVLDGGPAVLADLTELLRREPLVNWSAHGTLLHACARLAIPTGDISMLRSIDHVWIATAVARADVAGVTV